MPKRVAFGPMDRLILVGLYRLVPNTIKALTIVKPDIVIRWHRTGRKAEPETLSRRTRLYSRQWTSASAMTPA